MKNTLNDYITFSQAGKLLPGRPAGVTLWRWATKGLRAPDGSLVRLRHVRMGRKMLTKAEWLEEFAVDNAAAHEKAAPPEKPRIPTKAEAKRILANYIGK